MYLEKSRSWCVMLESQYGVGILILELNSYSGIHVVGKSSWKKREVGKPGVRKFPLKLESSDRTFQLPSFQFHFELSCLEVSNF